MNTPAKIIQIIPYQEDVGLLKGGFLFDYANNTTPQEKLAEWLNNRTWRPLGSVTGVKNPTAWIRPFGICVLIAKETPRTPLVVELGLQSQNKFICRLLEKEVVCFSATSVEDLSQKLFDLADAQNC